MIHFAQAVRGQSDLGRLMVKQMGEALESAQPEAFTEAMFKLAALLISSKGVAAAPRPVSAANTLVLADWAPNSRMLLFYSLFFSPSPSSRVRPSAAAPPLLVSSQDVHGSRHGDGHRLLGVAAGSSGWSGSACTSV